MMASPNSPENFEVLFAIHQAFSWDENLERLVEATNNIEGRGKRFDPTGAQRDAILASPSLADAVVRSGDYKRMQAGLVESIADRSKEILRRARTDSDNVNIRGNSIEQAITGEVNRHQLGDMIRHVGATEILLEIKTKLMDRASCPKAYNIDKALATLSSGRTLIAFWFVGVDINDGRVTSSTVSIFDQTVLDATHKQFHWAGRNSRGATQLRGKLSPLFSPNYQEQIDVAKAQRRLIEFLDLP